MTLFFLVLFFILLTTKCDAIVSVSNMVQLFHTISNGGSGFQQGRYHIMASGSTAELVAGVYKCNIPSLHDGIARCADDNYGILYSQDLFGEVKCEEDDASCILDAEEERRGMIVHGTSIGTLTFRALAFVNGEASFGGGVAIEGGAIVTIELCVFSNCRATWSSLGGGAIYVHSSGTTVNVYGTSFNGNTAASGNGDDIYKNIGTITIHNTCPSPFSSNTPIQGEMIMRFVQAVEPSHKALYVTASPTTTSLLPQDLLWTLMATSTVINTRTLDALATPVLPVAPTWMMAQMATSTASMGGKLEAVGARLPHFAPALYATLTTVVHTVR